MAYLNSLHWILTHGGLDQNLLVLHVLGQTLKETDRLIQTNGQSDSREILEH